MPGNPLNTEKILCMTETNLISLTIHAELLVRIRQLKGETNYLVHPKVIIRKALEHLIKRENKDEIKRELEDLLQHA